MLVQPCEQAYHTTNQLLGCFDAVALGKLDKFSVFTSIFL